MLSIQNLFGCDEKLLFFLSCWIAGLAVVPPVWKKDVFG
jgi:hypothetical protein